MRGQASGSRPATSRRRRRAKRCAAAKEPVAGSHRKGTSAKRRSASTLSANGDSSEPQSTHASRLPWTRGDAVTCAPAWWGAGRASPTDTLVIPRRRRQWLRQPAMAQRERLMTGLRRGWRTRSAGALPPPASFPHSAKSSLLLNQRVHANDVDSAVRHGACVSSGRAVDVDRHHGRRTARGREYSLQRDAALGHVGVVPQQQRVQAVDLAGHTVFNGHEDACDLALVLGERSIELRVNHVRIGPGDRLREHPGARGTDGRRREFLVPSVSLTRISVLPILSVADDCRIIGAERVVHKRIRRFVDVLGVDEDGRLRLTITRVAHIARLEHHLSDTSAVLALVALVAVVPLVALVTVVAVITLVALVTVITLV